MRTSIFRKCIPLSSSIRPFPRFGQSPILDHLVFNRHHISKSTHRNNVTYLSAGTNWSSSFWCGCSMTFVLGTGIAYSFFMTNPLRLEGNNQKLLHSDLLYEKYIPVIIPSSLDHASDTLRWEENAAQCGMGSGVLRYDSVRVQSNLPCEDHMNSASGLEEDEMRWLLWGVYDGHAYVLRLLYTSTPS